jgi:hypothetical protein
VRTVLAAVALAAILTACGEGSPAVTTSSPSTTALAPTTIPSTSSSTTSSSSPTRTTARPATTVPAPASPETAAKALFAAWAAGDRAAAAKVARPAAVDGIFARPWQATDGWSFSECNGAAGSTICTWRRPAGQQLMVRVENATANASEVRFQP